MRSLSYHRRYIRIDCWYMGLCNTTRSDLFHSNMSPLEKRYTSIRSVNDVGKEYSPNKIKVEEFHIHLRFSDWKIIPEIDALLKLRVDFHWKSMQSLYKKSEKCCPKNINSIGLVLVSCQVLSKSMQQLPRSRKSVSHSNVILTCYLVSKGQSDDSKLAPKRDKMYSAI